MARAPTAGGLPSPSLLLLPLLLSLCWATSLQGLQDEADNQENILSQLLGDYDKVKAVSEGPNCQCKCVVRPLSRGACQRLNEGASKPDDFYVVETITSGPECKCSCVAPPSALNPCEGDFRLKKLQEADSKDFKLAAVIEMLEGAFYGLDLLKLHTVTTKLLGRVEKLEEEVSRNLTKDNKSKRQNAEESLQEIHVKDKTNSSISSSNNLGDIQSSLQRDAAAAYTLTEGKYEEVYLHDKLASSQRISTESLHYMPQAHSKEMSPKSTLSKKPNVKNQPSSQPTIIRGITYYNAKDTETENELEEQDEAFSGDAIDLLIEDQLLQHNYLSSISTRKQPPTEDPLKRQSNEHTKGHAATTVPLENDAPNTTTLVPETPLPPAVMTPSSEPMLAPTSLVLSTTEGISAPLETTTAAEASSITWSKGGSARRTLKRVAVDITQAPIMTATPNVPTTKPPSPIAAITDFQIETTAEPRTVAAMAKAMNSPSPSLTATPKEGLDEEDVRNSIGQCKDTLSTISGPMIQNTYGRNEGAWMKDPVAKDERIYVTNYYYGNTLVEFRNLDNFKQGRWSNSYKLPYSWMGTGHAVFNGSLYYNRAFTRNLIKYDLKQRFVAAWAMLHDVAYDETPWRWRGHSDVDFAVDENGLWIIYPAINYEGFSQEVVVLSKLNANDLSIRKETTWRTGLRKNFYGNSFVICGVLYAVDSYNRKNANISYAFDTHTNTQIIPHLLFENKYSYTTQIDYNPKDRLLYAWDNGHQVTYNVIFAY
nr:olfactomedin-like protein 2B [Anolis sagrei ordinatus]